jgi:hypothetical protein
MGDTDVMVNSGVARVATEPRPRERRLNASFASRMDASHSSNPNKTKDVELRDTPRPENPGTPRYASVTNATVAYPWCGAYRTSRAGRACAKVGMRDHADTSPTMTWISSAQ